MNRELRQMAPWLALSAVALVVVLVVRHRSGAPSRSAEQSVPSWQRSYLELSPADQARFFALRTDGLAAIEKLRGQTTHWPSAEAVANVAPFDAPELTWVQRQHGLSVNYLGVPSDVKSVRWLVVFIEPDPKAPSEAPAPPDDEHHTLSDGTRLHVTVWSQPNEGAVPTDVLAFPVSDGWVQRTR